MNKFLPVIEHLTEVYKRWIEYRDNFPKKSRYTLGDKIDNLFLDVLELLFTASYQSSQNKLSTLEVAIKKIDLLKFFLRIAWEVRALDNHKYTELSEKVEELGRMVGGWKKGIMTKTLPH